MTLRILLRESISAARASRVPTLLVALVVAAMCFTAVATVGRQAAVEAAVAAELTGAQSRTLTVTDATSSAVLDIPTVALLSTLSGTEAVLARDLPVDAVNGALGPGSTRVAVVGIHGTVDSALQITRGRLPGADEVVIPEPMLRTLGLQAPIGYLEAADGTQWAIVGSFAPIPPFTDLATMAVTLPGPTPRAIAGGGVAYQQVRVVAASVADVPAVQNATLGLIAANPTEISVTSARAAAASEMVTGQLSGFGRTLLLLILGVGALTCSSVAVTSAAAAPWASPART